MYGVYPEFQCRSEELIYAATTKKEFIIESLDVNPRLTSEGLGFSRLTFSPDPYIVPVVAVGDALMNAGLKLLAKTVTHAKMHKEKTKQSFTNRIVHKNARFPEFRHDLTSYPKPTFLRPKCQ